MILRSEGKKISVESMYFALITIFIEGGYGGAEHCSNYAQSNEASFWLINYFDIYKW